MNGSNMIFTCYSCYQPQRTGDILIPDHILTMVLEGSSHAFFQGNEINTAAGECRFMTKNTLAKFSKHPSEHGEYKALSIALDQQILLEYSRTVNIPPQKECTRGSIFNLPPTSDLEHFFKSLAPYLDEKKSLFKQINNVKVTEAITILLDFEPHMASVLFDFSSMGKIDLESFMLKNFRSDVSLEEFARLTGRSLSTFKRDFQKIFHVTPYEWLKSQRLEEARFLIKERKLPPGDAALLVGFVNYSHFSRIFKEKYSLSPSDV